MNAHTPGPWAAITDYYSDGTVIVDAGGFKHVSCTNVAVLHDYQAKLGVAHWADSDKASREISLDEEVANARLIAAAPELLIAARRSLSVLRALGHKAERGNVIELLEKVVSKAVQP